MKLVTSKDGYIGHAMSIPHERQNKAHELVVAYNQISPADTKRREELLKQILGTYNEQIVIQMDSTPISWVWPMSTLELPSLTRVQ